MTRCYRLHYSAYMYSINDIIKQVIESDTMIFHSVKPLSDGTYIIT